MHDDIIRDMCTLVAVGVISELCTLFAVGVISEVCPFEIDVISDMCTLVAVYVISIVCLLVAVDVISEVCPLFAIDVISDVCPRFAVDVISEGMPERFVGRLLAWLSREVNVTRHLDFYVQWINSLLLHHGRNLKGRAGSMLPMWRTLSKNLERRRQELATV